MKYVLILYNHGLMLMLHILISYIVFLRKGQFI